MRLMGIIHGYFFSTGADGYPGLLPSSDMLQESLKRSTRRQNAMGKALAFQQMVDRGRFGEFKAMLSING